MIQNVVLKEIIQLLSVAISSEISAPGIWCASARMRAAGKQQTQTLQAKHCSQRKESNVSLVSLYDIIIYTERER